MTAADFVADGSNVDSSSPAVAAAIDVARAWKVQPGMKDGVPVPGVVRVPVRFEPGGVESPSPGAPEGVDPRAGVQFDADRVQLPRD